VLNVRPGMPAGLGRLTGQETGACDDLTLALAGADGMFAASPSLALAAAPPLTGASTSGKKSSW